MTDLESKYAQAEAKRIALKNELESREMTGDEWLKVSGEYMNASRLAVQLHQSVVRERNRASFRAVRNG